MAYADKAKEKEWKRRYKEAGKVREQNQKYYQKNRERCMSSMYFRQYGITLEEKKQMMLDQDNKCLICQVIFTDCRRCKTSAHVDHCHVTGKIRGILCSRCNLGLGHFSDSVTKLLSAARYMYKHKH